MQKYINPFIRTLRVPYIQYVTDIKHFVATGEEKYGFEVEQEAHVRLYTNKQHRQFVFGLSMYARDMILAVQYFLNYEYEYVILTYTKMQELYGPDYKLVRRRYDDTLRELIKMAILDVKDRSKGEYWYNPEYFCPGNRLKMFEQCSIKVKTEVIEPRKLKD